MCSRCSSPYERLRSRSSLEVVTRAPCDGKKVDPDENLATMGRRQRIGPPERRLVLHPDHARGSSAAELNVSDSDASAPAASLVASR